MKKLSCKIRNHDWIYGWNHGKEQHALRDCQECGKKQKHWHKWVNIA